MSDGRTLLVLTQRYDATADFVVAELAARDRPVFRCDPGDFPQTLTLVALWGEGWHGSLRQPGRPEAAGLDWRTDYDSLSYSVVTVPDPVREAVRRLLARLRLRFGALDFIVTPHDEWIFLEINPNGQWAWLQDATGLPIAAAIADALTKETT
ncbi:hypothetical protein [Couchioplanes caeruleus]|uniref:ATP-grasp domain-containing protein n=1 Tax=Couchioplanes caeruleus subsp. caeruleus TaxID=56427 RepID=A0A1K0GVP3_9ACTN|nr:hypothetical protein [Couchioplanes caeruleus]OJF13459.1 hypothetical protein BG844_15060 [Couchioplanes caeruleus subsp. caeruleus]